MPAVIMPRGDMETDEILQIAARLKKEGRAISPVTVCLEVYGQALPEITAALQQWRAKQQSAAERLREDLPVPADLRELMREAVEQCWARPTSCAKTGGR
jgi:hypothetical protein